MNRYTAVAATVFAALALLLAPVPSVVPAASAAGCPPVELVFARGRLQPQGPGPLGNALIGELRARVDRHVGFYAVRYDADADVDRGANDMGAHVQQMINNCPDTRLVLGGYSLGAAVTDVVLAVPSAMFGFNNPLPPNAADHIAAIALFGNGSAWAGPLGAFSPAFGERTIELCHAADPICNPADPNTWQTNWPDHLPDAYISAGMPAQAADFVAGRL